VNDTIGAETVYSVNIGVSPFNPPFPTLNKMISLQLLTTPAAVQEFIGHLSFAVTVKSGRSIEKTSLLRVVLLDRSALELETFPVASPSEWEQARPRLSRSVTLYWRILETIQLVFRDTIVHAERTLTMEDSTVFTDSSKGSRTTIDLCNVYSARDLAIAIERLDFERIKTIIDFGVSPTAQLSTGYVILEFFRALARRSNVSFNERDTGIARRLLAHPDIDWNTRIGLDQTTLLQYTVATMTYHSLLLLPWATIDLHHRGATGDTILHTHTGRGKWDRLSWDEVAVTRLLLRHGSVTLALALNDEGQRPSQTTDTSEIACALRTTVRAAEAEATEAVMDRLEAHITTRDLAELIFAYYTSFTHQTVPLHKT
jgi:hypothetical protein